MQKADIRLSDKIHKDYSYRIEEGTHYTSDYVSTPVSGRETDRRYVFADLVDGRDLSFRVALQRSKATVIYGPGSRPLFYTALLRQPKQLTWSAIPNTIACRVSLSEVGAEGAQSCWSSLAGNQDGYSWPLPDLALHSGVVYRWRIKPQSAMDLTLPIPTVALQESMQAREARFWLLPTDTHDRVRDGLDLLRDRSDPQFLPLAEAMFLAEYQLYQYALSRLPLFDATRNQAHAMLYETARCIIFRQMIEHMRQQAELPSCFMEWATQNEQYHRRLTQKQLPAQQSGSLRTHERYQRHLLPSQPFQTD